MRLEERDGVLVVAELRLEEMAFLSLGVPIDGETDRVLRALLSGQRVGMAAEALEYKRYKKTALLGVYQKFMGMERTLREMGIYVIRQSG